MRFISRCRTFSYLYSYPSFYASNREESAVVARFYSFLVSVFWTKVDADSGCISCVVESWRISVILSVWRAEKDEIRSVMSVVLVWCGSVLLNLILFLAISSRRLLVLS